jgi:hypothetical protein
MTDDELDKATADEAWRIMEEGQDVAVIAARLAREGWTPPEPVDPDVLACRQWMISQACSPDYREAVLAGKWDLGVSVTGYLAGARMARERADMPIRMAAELADRVRRLLEAMPLSVRAQWGVQADIENAFVKGVEAEITAYKAGKAAR